MAGFTKAVRKQKKLRMNLQGPSGSGKTMTALRIGRGMIGPDGQMALIDSEQESSTLYADSHNYDICSLTDSTVECYQDAIADAVRGKYDLLVIDSLSHAWEDLLKKHEDENQRQRGGNSFTAWAKITPIYNALISTILKAPIHVIATMRSKTEYVLQETQGSDGRNKNVPTKVGMAPEFRKGGEYEFDICGSLDIDHNLLIDKTRLAFLDKKVIHKANEDLGSQIRVWLDSGKVVPLPAEVMLSQPLGEGWEHVKTVGDLAATGKESLASYMQAYKESLPADELDAGRKLYATL